MNALAPRLETFLGMFFVVLLRLGWISCRTEDEVLATSCATWQKPAPKAAMRGGSKHVLAMFSLILWPCLEKW